MQTLQRYAHLLLVLPVFLLDRWTKVLVQDGMAFGDAIPVSSWLSIVHWQNKGGLFGLMADHGAGRLVFLLVPLVIIAGLAYYLIVCRPPLLWRLPLTFVLAGAIGNMYDRIFYGYVVDFVDVRLYGTYHWPAFNVADSSITFGIGMWLVAQFFLSQGTQKVDEGGKGIRNSR
jgi:signal peptidase II